MSLSNLQQDKLRRQLHSWRRELLDLSRRQSLLYFKHTKSASLEIALPGPAAALRLVDAGTAVLSIDGEGLRVRDKAADELARSTRRIDQLTRQALADRGVWTLYLGLGMLRWVDPDDGKAVDSPLVLVPVELRRPATSAPFAVHRSGDGASANLALSRKLEADLGLELPAVDESDVDVEGYLAAVSALVASKAGWSVQQRTILRNFTFHKEAIYRDLEENEDRVIGHPLVQLVSLGGEAPSAGGYDFTPAGDDDLDEVVPPERLFSILPADSSQRKCIIAARDGRSFVMDGPPGTGKSQTIANIVAELIGNGRTVLFVSEKAAALDVVRSRLADRGLDDFLLELHSHTSGRKEVAVALERALSQVPQARSRLDGADEASVVAARRELSAYAAAMNEVRPGLERSLFAVLGRLSSLPSEVDQGGTDGPDWAGLTSQRLSELRQEAEALAQVWRPVTEGEDFLWRSLTPGNDDAATVRRLTGLARELGGATTELLARLNAVDYDLPFGFAQDLAGARRRVSLLSALQDAPAVPSTWLTTNEWATVPDRARQRRQLADEHAAAASAVADTVGPGWPALDPEDLAVFQAGLTEPDATWHPAPQMTEEALAWVVGILAGSPRHIEQIQADARRLADAFGMSAPALTLHRAGELVDLAELAQTTTPPEARWLNPTLQAALEESSRVLEHLVTLAQQREQAVRAAFTREALDLDLVGLKARFAQTHRGLRAFSSAARADKKLLKSVTVAGKVDKATLALLDEAISWQQAEQALDAGERDHAASLGGYYRRTDTDFGRVSGALHAAREAVRLAGQELDPQALAQQVSTDRSPDPLLLSTAQRLRVAVRAWREALESALGVEAASTLLARPLTEVETWCQATAARLQPVSEAAGRVASVADRHVTLDEAQEAARLSAVTRRISGELDRTAHEDQAVLGERYAGLATDWAALDAALAWAARLRDAVGRPVPPNLVDRLARPTLSAGDLQEPLDRWCTARDRLVETFDEPRRRELADDLASSLSGAASTLQQMVESAGADITTWFTFAARLQRLRSRGLEDLVTTLVAGAVSEQTVADAVERAVLEAWVDAVVRHDPRLDNYLAQDRDETVRRFRDLDRKVVDEAYAGVVRLCADRRPRSLVGDAAVIRKEAQKKSRHLPVKEVLAKAGTVAQQVKPCFMMSPLSVSQYLPASMTFDAVIFDEASQVSPSDAINCIYRGSQLIVAGDQKQLPPTSFFARASDEDVEDEEADLDVFDSVLDLCKGAGALPSLPLTWHYRSRHEDLITFSNYRFYDGKLHTFPGARFEAPDLGVAYYNVHGTYQRGGARDNPVEAAAVVDRVVEHHRRHPRLSMGVVALSSAQADAIEAALEQRVGEDPSLEPLLERGDRLAGFFIKNLESVQGDERDIIIFSTGYGPDENGKVTMNFGPVTRKGGWRRLNVAITRARRRVEVVTSLHHSQIEPGANESHRHLRDYLHFAEKGRAALALDLDGSLGDAESPFEEEVIRVLQSWGYRPVPQVGAAGYRIDIGVRHPDRPGEYLMAVECDGAAYHSAKAARDRDRLREEVLVGLGWRVHRIWGLSWYRDRPGQEKRLAAALEQAMAADGVPESAMPARPAPPVLERLDVDLEARPEWAVPYQPAPGSTVWCPYEPHAAEARPYLREYLEQVVRAEAPLHEDVLYRRFREQWDVGSVGSRIRANISSVLNVISIDGQRVTKDSLGFIRYRATAAPQVRVATDDERRTVGQVPPEELEEALRLLARDAVSISEEQLSEAVARLFGWARRGPEIRAAVSGALARLVETDRITRGTDGRLS